MAVQTAKDEMLTVRAEKLGEDLGEKTLELLKLSDLEVMERAYEFADDSDEWYSLLDEIFERFAPEAWVKNTIKQYEGESTPAIEVACSRQYFYERSAARLAYRAAEGEA